MVGTRRRGNHLPKKKLPRVPSYSCFSCVNIVDVHAIICSHFVNHWGVKPKSKQNFKKKNEGDRVQDRSEF